METAIGESFTPGVQDEDEKEIRMLTDTSPGRSGKLRWMS
jgi:hypothetical protein